LGDRELDDARVARLREVIVATGAVAEVERRIAARAADAHAALESPQLGAASRAALDALVGVAVDRRA
jgi:geranylgeranyl diphosphate synthase type I